MAGVYIPADIYARYLRIIGKEVLFVCGSDEHGVAISMKAKNEGITPKQVIDKYHTIIKNAFDDFGISFDYYGRTSSNIHHKTAQSFFKEIYDQGGLEMQTSEQLYDNKEKQFLADRYVIGTCPKCGHLEAYGDQCESCGASLNTTDLINPKSVLSGEKPSLKKTTHWYLPLNKYESFLRSWILDEHQNDWKPNVLGQVKSWLDDGLRPRAVTRDLSWGIPVPVKGGENKVLYVWFDAPIGYISASKEWGINEGKDWKPFWQDPNTELVHFIGKDNIVFHCIIFPAMLKAMNNFILPKNVPANEFLNLEGQKLSTSKNWAVWLHEYLEDFPNKQDVLRYVLTANAPETKDNDFTWSDFQNRNNGELVAIFGNFVNRVMVLMGKYYNGIVPKPVRLTNKDEEVLKVLNQLGKKIGLLIEQYKFRSASQEMIQLARTGNKYLADEEPWKQIKLNPDRVATIMFTAIQVVGGLAIISEPFLPNASNKLFNMLLLKNNKRWCDLEKDILIKPNHLLGKAELLFDKIDDDEISFQKDKLLQSN
jgi:methionyl-tRNA synthetase